MRRFLKSVAVLLAASLALYATAPAAAAGPGVMSVSPPTQAVSPGAQFTVSITVQPNNSIAGAQFDLSFNPALVTASAVTEGNLLKQNGANTFFMPGTIDNNAGTISGVAGAITAPGQTVSTPGTFAVITFTAGSTKGTSSLTLSTVIIGDVNGQSVPVTTSDGQVSVDRAPVLAAIGSKSVNEGALLSFNISGSDPDGDMLTYSASNLPSGAVFTPATRTFSWTPGYTHAGTYPGVHFQVSDGSLTTSEDITITVTPAGQPAVTTNAAANVTASTATFSGNLTSRGDATSVTVSFEYGLTTAYGSAAPGAPATLTDAGSFTATAGDLTPSTLYHYRARAAGSNTVYGADRTFTTLATAGVGGGGGGGGGGGFGLTPLISGTGTASWWWLQGGYTPTSVTVTSANGNCVLSIPASTLVLAKDYAPQPSVTLVSSTSLPAAPDGKEIIDAYDLGPPGTTTDPSVTVSFKYDPASLRDGADESRLVIASYDPATETWTELDGVTVDTANHTASGKTKRLGTFAILCNTPAPPPATPTPATLPPATAPLVSPQGPASFTVSDLTISPVSARVGEEVSISLMVKNTGDMDGTCELRLTVNGNPVSTRSLSLAGKAAAEQVFTLAQTTPGTYAIDVNGLNGSVDFTESTTSPASVLLLGVTTNYDDKTGQPVSARIDFRIDGAPSVDLSTAVLIVKLNGQTLETVTGLSLSRSTPGGTAGGGNMVYSPSRGWQPGRYTFAVQVASPEGVLLQSQEEALSIASPRGFMANWPVSSLVPAAVSIMAGSLAAAMSLRRRAARKRPPPTASRPTGTTAARRQPRATSGTSSRRRSPTSVKPRTTSQGVTQAGATATSPPSATSVKPRTTGQGVTRARRKSPTTGRRPRVVRLKEVEADLKGP